MINHSFWLKSNMQPCTLVSHYSVCRYWYCQQEERTRSFCAGSIFHLYISEKSKQTNKQKQNNQKSLKHEGKIKMKKFYLTLNISMVHIQGQQRDSNMPSGSMNTRYFLVYVKDLAGQMKTFNKIMKELCLMIAASVYPGLIKTTFFCKFISDETKEFLNFLSFLDYCYPN